MGLDIRPGDIACGFEGHNMCRTFSGIVTNTDSGIDLFTPAETMSHEAMIAALRLNDDGDPPLRNWCRVEYGVPDDAPEGKRDWADFARISLYGGFALVLAGGHADGPGRIVRV